MTIFAFGVIAVYQREHHPPAPHCCLALPRAAFERRRALGAARSRSTRTLRLSCSSVVQAYGSRSSSNARPGCLAACRSSLTPALRLRVMAVVTLTTGSIFVMWLGEQITERGIGNGMSLLIFAASSSASPKASSAR